MIVFSWRYYSSWKPDVWCHYILSYLDVSDRNVWVFALFNLSVLNDVPQNLAYKTLVQGLLCLYLLVGVVRVLSNSLFPKSLSRKIACLLPHMPFAWEEIKDMIICAMFLASIAWLLCRDMVSSSWWVEYSILHPHRTASSKPCISRLDIIARACYLAIHAPERVCVMAEPTIVSSAPGTVSKIIRRSCWRKVLHITNFSIVTWQW